MKTALAPGVVVVIVTLALAAVLAVFVLSPNRTTSTATNSYVVTSGPSPYFPNGYESLPVNFSSIRDGDVLVVGATSIRYYLPSNLESRTTTVSSTVTTITTTADYQCGNSLGQRRFFEARLVNGSEFQLDYCLVLNSAIAQGAYRSSTAHSWSLWQISGGTAPIVAIHMSGQGEYVDVTELWVSK